MRYLFLTALLFAGHIVFAQSAAGKISIAVTADNSPAGNATATLMKNKKFFKAAVADAKGNVAFENLPLDTFTVRISAAGYEEKILPVILTATSPEVSLPATALIKNNNTQLKTVTVAARKPFIQKLSDRIVVNVDNSIISTGSSAMDVLERSPGITIDRDENVNLKGRTGVTFMIDGRLTPMSGTELANYLKSLPAASIDRIDIITNPSAKYDAAGNSGIIDIRLKKISASARTELSMQATGRAISRKQAAAPLSTIAIKS